MKTAAVIFTAGLALATYALKASSNNAPDGWSIGGEAPKLYSAEIDKSDSPSGAGSMVLRRTESSHPYGSAYLAKTMLVEPYAGKKVRVSLHARFEGAPRMEGQIFVGADGGTHLQGIDIGNGWNQYEITVTLPASLTRLAVGVGLKGAGSAKVDDIELEIVGTAPPEQRGINLRDFKLNGAKPGKWTE